LNYWLTLFTGTTWKEFLDSGGRVSGHSHRKRGTVAKMKSGVLLAYMTGVTRWVA
jgi:hypothetical protein